MMHLVSCYIFTAYVTYPNDQFQMIQYQISKWSKYPNDHQLSVSEHFLGNSHSVSHMLLMPIETLRYERDCLRKVREAHLIHDKAKWKNRLLLLRRFASSLSLRLDEDRIVSHDAPRFRLYFHCVRDISKWSVIFSTREMNIAVLDGWFQTCFGSATSAFEIIELAYIR